MYLPHERMSRIHVRMRLRWALKDIVSHRRERRSLKSLMSALAYTSRTIYSYHGGSRRRKVRDIRRSLESSQKVSVRSTSSDTFSTKRSVSHTGTLNRPLKEGSCRALLTSETDFRFAISIFSSCVQACGAVTSGGGSNGSSGSGERQDWETK